MLVWPCAGLNSQYFRPFRCFSAFKDLGIGIATALPIRKTDPFSTEFVMHSQYTGADSLSPESVSWIISEGFNPQNLNEPGKYEDTPLILACRKGELSVVTELLKADVDVNHRNMDGTNALWASIVANSFEIAERLLESGVDLDNRNDHGATALMYASSAGKTEWVNFLLKKNARTDVESLDGFTALDLAANIGCLKLLKSA